LPSKSCPAKETNSSTGVCLTASPSGFNAVNVCGYVRVSTSGDHLSPNGLRVERLKAINRFANTNTTGVFHHGWGKQLRTS